MNYGCELLLATIRFHVKTCRSEGEKGLKNFDILDCGVT